MQKRGTTAQASFEYIVIYGWATLIILSSLGVLYSFDLLNFNSFASDECVFYGQISCVEAQFVANVDDEGSYTIVLQNNFGTNLVVYGIDVTDEYFSCEPLVEEHKEWNQSEKILLTSTCGETGVEDFAAGTRTDSKVTLQYYRNISICNDGLDNIAPNCLFTAQGRLKHTIVDG